MLFELGRCIFHDKRGANKIEHRKIIELITDRHRFIRGDIDPLKHRFNPGGFTHPFRHDFKIVGRGGHNVYPLKMGMGFILIENRLFRRHNKECFGKGHRLPIGNGIGVDIGLIFIKRGVLLSAAIIDDVIVIKDRIKGVSSLKIEHIKDGFCRKRMLRNHSIFKKIKDPRTIVIDDVTAISELKGKTVGTCITSAGTKDDLNPLILQDFERFHQGLGKGVGGR